jgi:predicted amino acid-binding ACT domain protein
VATSDEVRALLEPTSLPATLVDELIDGASPVWLMGEPAEAVAGDLVLAHPPLRSDEVRAAVKPTAEDDLWRLTVAARDRAGLLADIAGVLAAQDLSITSISASAWTGRRLAILRLAISAPGTQTMGAEDWDRVGEGLRSALSGKATTLTPQQQFQPAPPVRVTTTPGETGRVVLRLEAPDRVGLLWAVASWLNDREANIEVARVETRGDQADDTFVIDGVFDPAELATYLSGTDSTVATLTPLTVARAAASTANQVGRAAAAVTGALVAGAQGRIGVLMRRLPGPLRHP